MPMASGRIARGTAAASRVSESGMIAAAPRPWTARAAISASEVGAERRGDRGEREDAMPDEHHPAPAEPVAERRPRAA